MPGVSFHSFRLSAEPFTCGACLWQDGPTKIAAEYFAATRKRAGSEAQRLPHLTDQGAALVWVIFGFSRTGAGRYRVMLNKNKSDQLSIDRFSSTCFRY